MLRKMWGDKTADEAYAILEKPDITVTNQKDKDVQLRKLLKLNEFTKNSRGASLPRQHPRMSSSSVFFLPT